jgi:DTW domain-containing protein YfiP
MLLRLCICDLIPTIKAKTKLVIAMHVAERNKPSNSARILELALSGTEVRLQGLEHQQINLDGIVASQREAFLLFPDGPTTPADLLKIEKPITLVIPDGTWKQAKKIAHVVTERLKLPQVGLGPGALSSYQLRTPDRIGRISTLEAVVSVLEVLEGPDIANQLRRVFDEMVKRVLSTRR